MVVCGSKKRRRDLGWSPQCTFLPRKNRRAGNTKGHTHQKGIVLSSAFCAFQEFSPKWFDTKESDGRLLSVRRYRTRESRDSDSAGGRERDHEEASIREKREIVRNFTLRPPPTPSQGERADALAVAVVCCWPAPTVADVCPVVVVVALCRMAEISSVGRPAARARRWYSSMMSW